MGISTQEALPEDLFIPSHGLWPGWVGLRCLLPLLRPGWAMCPEAPYRTSAF